LILTVKLKSILNGSSHPGTNPNKTAQDSSLNRIQETGLLIGSADNISFEMLGYAQHVNVALSHLQCLKATATHVLIPPPHPTVRLTTAALGALYNSPPHVWSSGSTAQPYITTPQPSYVFTVPRNATNNPRKPPRKLQSAVPVFKEGRMTIHTVDSY
jgi:hypothetical protein